MALKDYAEEEKFNRVVRKCLGRMMWKCRTSCFEAWVELVDQNKRVKLLCRRLMNRRRDEYFDQWADFIMEKRAKREATIQRCIRRIIFRGAAMAFTNWDLYRHLNKLAKLSQRLSRGVLARDYMRHHREEKRGEAMRRDKEEREAMDMATHFAEARARAWLCSDKGATAVKDFANKLKEYQKSPGGMKAINTAAEKAKVKAAAKLALAELAPGTGYPSDAQDAANAAVTVGGNEEKVEGDFQTPERKSRRKAKKEKGGRKKRGEDSPEKNAVDEEMEKAAVMLAFEMGSGAESITVGGGGGGGGGGALSSPASKKKKKNNGLFGGALVKSLLSKAAEAKDKVKETLGIEVKIAFKANDRSAIAQQVVREIKRRAMASARTKFRREDPPPFSW